MSMHCSKLEPMQARSHQGDRKAVNGDTTSKSQASGAALRRPRHAMQPDIPTYP
jgi:hypothetical protein